MVAVEVFVTIAGLALLGLLLLAGAALILGRRLRLNEWYRRDRRRLELYQEREHRRDQEEEAARAAALAELQPGDRAPGEDFDHR